MNQHKALCDALGRVAPIDIDQSGPVFDEPWQAQAFATVLHLHDIHLFSWGEWVDCLSRQISARERGNVCHDLGYWGDWLNALEAIIIEKGVSDASALSQRAEAWDRAAHATPHGQPIMLENDPVAQPAAT